MVRSRTVRMMAFSSVSLYNFRTTDQRIGDPSAAGGALAGTTTPRPLPAIDPRKAPRVLSTTWTAPSRPISSWPIMRGCRDGPASLATARSKTTGRSGRAERDDTGTLGYIYRPRARFLPAAHTQAALDFAAIGCLPRRHLGAASGADGVHGSEDGSTPTAVVMQDVFRLPFHSWPRRRYRVLARQGAIASRWMRPH
jgi:hypothetical protein